MVRRRRKRGLSHIRDAGIGMGLCMPRFVDFNMLMEQEGLEFAGISIRLKSCITIVVYIR